MSHKIATVLAVFAGIVYKPGMARPIKKHGRKEANIRLRCTPQQRERYELAADACKEEFADWARKALDEAASRALEDS